MVDEVKPLYTAEAMRALQQGTVFIEALVLPDGTVGSARALESFGGKNASTKTRSRPSNSGASGPAPSI